MCLSKQTLEILLDIKQKHEKDSKLMDINDKQLMLPSKLNDDDVELNVFRCRADILETNCDQCVSMVHYCLTSTETIRLIRTGCPAQPPRLLHSSWTWASLMYADCFHIALFSALKQPHCAHMWCTPPCCALPAALSFMSCRTLMPTSSAAVRTARLSAWL